MAIGADPAGRSALQPPAPLEVHEAGRLGIVLRWGFAVVGVGLFFTNLDSQAFAAWSAPPPITWVLAFAAAAAALVLLDLTRPTSVLRSPLLAWVVLYFLVTTAWAVWTPLFPEVIQELRDRYRSMLFLVTFMVLLDDARARRAAIVAVALAVVLAALVNLAEFLSLVTFTNLAGRVPGRAAGFYINPNSSGLAIALGLGVALPSLPKAWRAPLLLIGAVGIAVTFSRGGSVCLGLVLFALIARGSLGPRYVGVVLLSASLLFAYGGEYVQDHDLLNSNTSSRARLEHDDSGRLALATKAWEMFTRAPLTGNGLGSTTIWDAHVQAHNVPLTLAADHGVLGLLLFPALGLALVASHRRAAIYALALMASGFTSHGMLENRFALLLTALAAAAPAARTGADPAREDGGAS